MARVALTVWDGAQSVRCASMEHGAQGASFASAAKLDATWRVYCIVARSATDTSERIAQEATDALDALRQCLSRA